jgi:CspA family cold shock protein
MTKDKVQLGTVKWWNTVRGYGFIIADAPEEQENPDVLAHYSRIEGRALGRRDLREGQRVRFTEELTPKGRMATWIAPAGPVSDGLSSERRKWAAQEAAYDAESAL